MNISHSVNNPKVSVIVPVYNAESYLVRCIDSLLSQTLKDIELIFINDCSTDNSMDILSNIAITKIYVYCLQKETANRLRLELLV